MKLHQMKQIVRQTQQTVTLALGAAVDYAYLTQGLQQGDQLTERGHPEHVQAFPQLSLAGQPQRDDDAGEPGLHEHDGLCGP